MADVRIDTRGVPKGPVYEEAPALLYRPALTAAAQDPTSAAVDPQHLDLTFGPATVITMPPTGTGGAPDGGGSAWGTLSLMLGLAGLAGAATGFALRRRQRPDATTPIRTSL
jgi:hypothetical protein